MSRIHAVEPQQARWFIRFVYWMTKRKLGRVILPVKIAAHHPRLLRAIGAMEWGQAAAQSLPMQIKALAEIKAAILVGCPF
jgi:hypothetical protein